MEHPYLTDWELYIVFCNYYKIQKIEVKLVLYFALLRKNLLPTWSKLSFADTSLNIAPSVLRLPAGVSPEYRDKVTKPRPYKTFFFKSHTPFRQWLQEYVNKYQEGLLNSRKEFQSNANSLQNTATFLRKLNMKDGPEYFTVDSQTISQITKSLPDGAISHPYEDILVLLQEGYLNLNDVTLENSNILTEKFTEKSIPRFTLNLTVLKPFSSLSIIKILSRYSTQQSPISISTPTVVTQTSAVSENLQLQASTPKILHKIDYKKDFLPYNDMLVLLALYKAGNYVSLPTKAKESLSAIRQMKFLKPVTGSEKHIRSVASQFFKLSKKVKISTTNEADCIIHTKKESINEYLKNYLDRYQQDKLNNHSHYCLYNESWDRTIRMLNSLKAEYGENYCITPQTIENKKTILNAKTRWIECLFILIRSGQIQLTEANLEWSHSLNFSLGITQTSEIPLVKNALCEYLGISITRDNKVQYRGYPIKFQANSREFMFLKFLLINKGAEGRNVRIVSQFFVKEYQKLGIKIDETKITDDKLTAYQNAINKKFESISKKVPIDFWITAGKTENKLEPLSSETLKRSRKRHKKLPRNH